MPDGIQSIEDLLRDSSEEEGLDDESVQGKFAKKQKEIKIKEMERSTKQAADRRGVPYVDLFAFPISPDALVLLSEKEAQELEAVCFFYDGNQVRIGTVNPDNPAVLSKLKDLRDEYYVEGKLYLISRHSLDYAIKLYKSLPKVRKFIKGVEIKGEDIEKFEKDISEYKALDKKIKEVSITDVITLVLATGLKTEASDIHIEAEEDKIAIRLRIDGVLQEAATMQKNQWKKIISRLKLLAKVKLNITDKPQDGRFSIFLAQEKVEVRCSFLPTSFGESVAMRLLRSSAISLKFEELGLRPEAFDVLRQEIAKPNGLILTTGPTGSGKTTTLYAILKKLNNPETKIITLENPVEYQLEGISQSQVDPSKDYSFAKGLRSILRQDPDIVMVGEVRDLETAEIAIQASLTGHLVLSTLHTNDASGVLPRLIDMGIKPYFMTPAINAVIGQRLVRRLCDNCKQEYQLEGAEADKVKKILAVISPKSNVDVPNEIPPLYRAGKGCEHCNGIGYKGRVGIYEIFTMSDDIKELAAQNAPAFKILKQAIENGMLTMLQDGVLKCLEGVSSLDEVYRVIGKTDYVDALYDVVISQTFGRGIRITADNISLAKTLAQDIESAKQEISELSNKERIAVLMALALEHQAGDIHLEPTENSLKIRFRIDGILHDIVNLPQDQYLSMLARIKTLAGFSTNIKQATWDGRFSLFLEERKMDCRISIISGGYGETVVIRVLANQAASLDMQELGMRPYTLNVIKKSIKSTKGIIINTGPTGSGKTTTLYSILNKLNQPDVKIITVEDPIEYHLEGVMQTQVDPEQGYTFAQAMRSLLRQNPNIMMIGEIRDRETAGIAIEASLTGHLVLSTIHANSAAGAITRFTVLGVERQQLANSLECSIGQRLVRRICPHCKVETEIEPDILDQVKASLSQLPDEIRSKIPDKLTFYKGAGCDKCKQIGYKNRLGIYEVIDITPGIQKLLLQPGITDAEIEEAAVKEGSVLLRQDGILKALDGETTLEEVLRVTE
jgi:type IV pilus assembly protein PilB